MPGLLLFVTEFSQAPEASFPDLHNFRMAVGEHGRCWRARREEEGAWVVGAGKAGL
jgi:hypothetical protein